MLNQARYKVTLGALKSLLLVALFPLSSQAGDWDWALQENYVELGAARQEWTISDAYVGNKLLFDVHYNVFAKPDLEKSDSKADVTRLYLTLDAELQWGSSEDIEYSKVGFTAYSTEWERKRDDWAGFHTARDQLEWGVVQIGKDEPIAIESYTELTFARLGRLGLQPKRRFKVSFSCRC